MADPTLPDLIRTLPLHGRRLIEASAGTGKTYTLAGLYLRLVLGVGGTARMPPDILVLTFTRAATRELRDRIRARLVEAGRAFGAGGSPDDQLQWLVDQFPAERHASCVRLLEVAAGWMDEAAIHTIHGWCQTMLRQHAFDSGSLFDQEVDAADPSLYRNAVADYWRDHIVIDHPLADALVEQLGDPLSLGERLAPLLRPGVVLQAGGQTLGDGLPPCQALDRLAAWQAERDRRLEPVRAGWLAESGVIRAIVFEALERGELNGNKIDPGRAEQWFQAVDDWAGAGGPVPDVLIEKFRAGYVETLPKARQPVPRHPWFEQVEQAAGELDALGPPPDWLAPVLAHAAGQVAARLREEKQRRNRIDFEDLLLELDRALAGAGAERLRATILAQYPIALVDEFQDTDPVQYRIFERIWGACGSEDPARGLFLIGDPKQSIYSFRGADIHAYLAARAATGSQHTLGRNFRATEGMVAAVNHLFSIGERHPRGAFAFSEPGGPRRLPFEPVQAAGRPEVLLIDGRPACPLTLCYLPAGPGSKTVGLGEYIDDMAERSAEQVACLLQRASQGRALFEQSDTGRTVPLQAADIAILVRTGKQAGLVRRALAARGVGSVYLSDQASVFDEPQAVELSLVLAAVIDPGSERKLKSALVTRLFGGSVAALDRLNHDEQQLEALFERFTALRECWQRQGVLAMIHALLADFDLAARLLADPINGERALTNVLHLAELLQAESQVVDGERALLHWLDEQIDNRQRGRCDDELLRLESDAGLVKVVTLHAAKGLEYPLVFVPFACHYRAENYIHSWIAHGPGGQRVVDLAPDRSFREQVLLETLQEDLRLFYVALTRARHACWLGLAPVLSGSGKNKPPALDRFAPGHLLLGLADDPESPQDMPALLERLAAGAADAIRIEEASGPPALTRLPDAAGAVLGPARVAHLKPRRPWWIASYSALGQASDPGGAEAPQDATEDQAREEIAGPEQTPGADAPVPGRPSLGRGVHAFPRGPRPGTFLHGLLEWAGRQGLAETAAEPSGWLDQIQRRCQRRGWGHWAGLVQRWMLDQLVLPMTLGKHTVRLAGLARGHYTPELEFWFQASRVEAVELDRMVRSQTFGGKPRAPLAARELNGMMRGFVDLVFEHGGRYYVLDYKSNHLGDRPEDYRCEAIRASVLAKRYDLQLAIYTLALHRLLQSRLADYDYQRHVGGAVYVYLRGHASPGGGVFHYCPDQALIEALDRLFAGRERDDAA
ncbi:MAG: exodeoxyribonuclease V subunit beta [Wenzhouxiangella sp.]